MSPLAAPAAAIAIIAAGCASAGATGPGGADGAAKIVPANAVAFVAATTDLTSSQWHGLGRFALTQLQKQTKLDWSADVQPAVGDELDVALLPGDKAVAFVQPSDSAKLDAFAKKHDSVTRVFGDWTAVAGDAATLDAVAAAKSHLADNTLYLEAMSRLPSGALVTAWANGDRANTIFAAVPGQLESRLLPVGAHYRVTHHQGPRTAGYVGVQDFRWIAASLIGTDKGLELKAIAPQGELTANGPPRLAVKPIAPYTSSLVDEIPSGVLAVVDVQLPVGAFELMPSLPDALDKLFGPQAIGLATQLDALLGGETALYVRPAFPTPEITLVTSPADTDGASTTLDELLRALPKSGMLADLQLHRAVIGGQFVVSTTQSGIDAFRGGGAKLSADPGFLEAKRQSGMPERTTGFAYANVKSALPLLALAGVSLPADLPRIGAVTAYGAESNGESTFTTFVQVSGS